MSGRPRSRPSWTPSASKVPCFSGLSEGGPAAIVFAATRPERTRALILTGAFAYSFADGWDDLERDPAELRARLVPELGEDYTPSVEQLARWQDLGRAIRSAWGSGEATKALLPSGPLDTLARHGGAHERQPGDGARGSSKRCSGSTCGRSCRRSPCPPWSSMPATTSHSGAVRAGTSPITFPVHGWSKSRAADHVPWLADPDRIATEIEEFLTGSHAAPSLSRRALRTVLFTDIVASTQHAAATGDERWRAVLHRFDEITAELTERFGGTVVESTGDGHLITFDGPTQAIRCAEAVAR